MIGLSLGIATMGAIIGGGALAGGVGARAAFVSGLSDALRVNAGIALFAALVATATITAATRPRGERIIDPLVADPAAQAPTSS
jgi:hypothetical protein